MTPSTRSASLLTSWARQSRSPRSSCKDTDSHISATLKQAGTKLQEVGSKISGVGTSLTTHVTAPIVGIGAASLAAFNEVDAGLDIVAQKTGATGKTLEGMNQIVKDLATEIPTDFETAGAAVGEVNTRFGLTGQALDDLSGKFIKFAQLNDTDVSTSIDNVSSVMSHFALSGEVDAALITPTPTGAGDQIPKVLMYDRIVLFHWFARHLDALERLPTNYQYTMICNSACYYDCKWHDAHWFLKADNPELYGKESDRICANCTALLAKGKQQSSYIEPEDLRYFDPYVSCYKLVDRYDDTDTIFNRLYSYSNRSGTGGKPRDYYNL